MNHQYTILHQNDFGYVSICENCDHIQLSMGNIIHCLACKEFKNLQKGINAIKLQLDLESFSELECILPNGQKIIMKSPDKSILFSFSRSEFRALTDLMENAALMMEVRKTLSK